MMSIKENNQEIRWR